MASCRFPNSPSQRKVRHITIGRRPHHSLVEIPLGAVELGLELIDFGLMLLDVEATAGVALQQLGELTQPQLRKLELGLECPHRRAIRRRVDREQHLPSLERRIGLHRHIKNFTSDIRDDLHGVTHNENRALGRPPPHWDEQAQVQQ